MVRGPKKNPVATTIPMVRPCLEPDDGLMEDIRTILKSGQVTNYGPMVRKFEDALAHWLGTQEVACVASGSAALMAAIMALDPGPGKAILPSFTYISTVNAVVSNGLTPVFCDIDPHRFTLDPDHLHSLLRQHGNVRLIIPVNVYGIPPDMNRIRDLAGSKRIPIVADNAHGLGTRVEGRPLMGGVSVQIFSLHVTKALPSIEGGVVASEDPELINEVRRICNHGLAPDRLASRIGFNGKMNEIQALVANHSLASFQETLERRRAYFQRFRDLIQDELSTTHSAQWVPEGIEPNGQNLGVRHSLPSGTVIEDVCGWYREFGVETRRYFWPALHQMTAYQSPEPLPNTDRVVETLLCLPLHSYMDDRTLCGIEKAARKVADRLGS